MSSDTSLARRVPSAGEDYALVSRHPEHAVGGVAHLSHRERDDNYHAVICRIDDRVRVINCNDDMQWIVQTFLGGQWRGLSFCRTQDALIRDARRRLTAVKQDAEMPVDALAILHALPVRHA